MAVSDEIFVISIGFIVNFLWIYRKSPLIGAFFNTLLGGLITYQGTTMSTSVDPIYAGVGVVIVLISIVDAVWTLMPKSKKGRKR